MKEKAWIVVFPMIFWSFFDLYFHNTFLQGCYLLLKILWRHTSCSSPALEVCYRSASFVATMAMTWGTRFCQNLAIAASQLWYAYTPNVLHRFGYVTIRWHLDILLK